VSVSVLHWLGVRRLAAEPVAIARRRVPLSF
jgi:hypothetical protein